MLLTLIFKRTDSNTYTAYIEEMPEILTIRGNNLEQVRLDVFTELAFLLNYWNAEEEEVTLVTKHWLQYPFQGKLSPGQEQE